MTLCPRDQFVCRVIRRSDLLDARVDRDVRPCIVVAPAPVARDVAGEHAQHPRRILGLADEKPRLRQAQKAQKRFLHAIQGIVSPHALPSHHPNQSCPVGVHERRYPAEKSFRANLMIHDHATSKLSAASASRCASAGEKCFASLA